MNQLSHQYGTYEKQEELLAMIKDIDLLFSQNSITYSLCGGTLLGAVRENGFIPWDDDVDIMVDRNNYNRIITLFNSLGDNTDYTLRQYLWIDRIQRKDDIRYGLYAATVDVFVMDKCPNNYFLRHLKVFLIKLLQGMMKEEQIYENQSFLYKACLWFTHMIGKPLSNEIKYKWYHIVSQIGDKRDAQHLTGYTDLFKLLNLQYTGHLFDNLIQHQFEDITLPITAEYDSYLRTQYGDYMTPPREENRIPIHTA